MKCQSSPAVVALQSRRHQPPQDQPSQPEGGAPNVTTPKSTPSEVQQWYARLVELPSSRKNQSLRATRPSRRRKLQEEPSEYRPKAESDKPQSGPTAEEEVLEG